MVTKIWSPKEQEAQAQNKTYRCCCLTQGGCPKTGSCPEVEKADFPLERGECPIPNE